MCSGLEYLAMFGRFFGILLADEGLKGEKLNWNISSVV